MPFPITDREVYHNNPLDEVVCQFDFSPILEISSTSPFRFQNKIRGDYPVYREARPELPEAFINIQKAMGLLPGSPFADMTEHWFSTSDGSRSVVLTHGSISIIERQYEQWAMFKPSIERCVSMLEECYEPAFYTRVGLRYRDVIDKTKYGMGETPWSELLDPAFRGLIGHPNLDENELLSSEAQLTLRIPDVEDGIVVIRYGLLPASQDNLDVYMLDADFCTEKGGSSNEAFAAADRFHWWASNLFRWATTEKLRGALG